MKPQSREKEGKARPSVKRAKDGRWLPGASGNPKGRPRLHDALAQDIRDRENGRLALAIDRLWDKAVRGDIHALEWLVSHGWGKPPVELTGEDGGPLEIVVRHARGGKDQ